MSALLMISVDSTKPASDTSFEIIRTEDGKMYGNTIETLFKENRALFEEIWNLVQEIMLGDVIQRRKMKEIQIVVDQMLKGEPSMRSVLNRYVIIEQAHDVDVESTFSLTRTSNNRIQMPENP